MGNDYACIARFPKVCLVRKPGIGLTSLNVRFVPIFPNAAPCANGRFEAECQMTRSTLRP